MPPPFKHEHITQTFNKNPKLFNYNNYTKLEHFNKHVQSRQRYIEEEVCTRFGGDKVYEAFMRTEHYYKFVSSEIPQHHPSPQILNQYLNPSSGLDIKFYLTSPSYNILDKNLTICDIVRGPTKTSNVVAWLPCPDTEEKISLCLTRKYDPYQLYIYESWLCNDYLNTLGNGKVPLCNDYMCTLGLEGTYLFDVECILKSPYFDVLRFLSPQNPSYNSSNFRNLPLIDAEFSELHFINTLYNFSKKLSKSHPD